MTATIIELPCYLGRIGNKPMANKRESALGQKQSPKIGHNFRPEPWLMSDIYKLKVIKLKITLLIIGK